jgi:hypothetical protein
MNFKTLKERLKMTNKYTFEVIDYGEMLEREAKRITKDMDEYIIKKLPTETIKKIIELGQKELNSRNL